MADKDTPPTGTPIAPPRPLPTTATVQALVEVLLREMRGVRIDIDQLKTDVKAVRLQVVPDPDVIRLSPLPRPSALPVVPSPRPSMAAKAAHGTGRVGRAVLLATGALTVAGQVVALWRPEYAGPLAQALKLLAAIGGAE